MSVSEETSRGLIYLRDLLVVWGVMPEDHSKVATHCIELSPWVVIHVLKWLLRVKYSLLVGIKKEFEVFEVVLVEFINRLSEISKRHLCLLNTWGFQSLNCKYSLGHFCAQLEARLKRQYQFRSMLSERQYFMMGRHRASRQHDKSRAKWRQDCISGCLCLADLGTGRIIVKWLGQSRCSLHTGVLDIC